MVKYLLTILILLVLSATGFAQHAVGIDVGYSDLGESDRSSSTTKFMTTGLRYEIKNPCDTCEVLTIWVEENYDRIWINRDSRDCTVGYIRTGLGFDFSFGNRLKYLLGVGITYKFLIQNFGFLSIDEVKKTVTGFKINTGFSYNLTNQLVLRILGQYYRDTNVSFIFGVHEFNGGLSSEYVINKVYYLQISIHYLFKKRKSK